MSNPIRDQFREGLVRGELLLQQCQTCSKLNMYPRHACPHCQSKALGWQRARGNGVLHSFTVLRAGSNARAEALREWANAKLGKTQRLAALEVVEHLPRSAIGK